MGKKNSGSPLLIGAAIVIGIVASVPKAAWIGLAVLAAAVFLIRYFMKASPNTKVTSSAVEPATQSGLERGVSPTGRTLVAKPPFVPSKVNSDPERLINVTASGGALEKEYLIPAVPSGVFGKPQWVPPGQSITVAGLELPDGMLYVGTGLRTGYQGVEPALINPNLKVALSEVDVSQTLTDYWPSYSTITPEARRAYLSWLSNGRSEPSANIGYVFLFFYGLEHRILLDAQKDSTARAETPALISEIRRLLGIYSGNHSFCRYATQLLEFIASTNIVEKSYLASPPEITGRGHELPLSLRIGLGQLAVDQKPVPSAWALAWVLWDPNILRRTPITRCPGQFSVLFQQKYTAAYGSGLTLKANRTKLRASYTPASSSLNYNDFSRTISDLPDVSAVKTPVTKLQQLVDDCVVELDPYSRYIGRNPDKTEALEGLLQLPVSLWPVTVRTELEELKARVGDGLVLMTFGELSGRLKSAGVLSRDKVLGLARALESLHLGMEPDVLAGNKTPKAEDKISLFATSPEDGTARNTPAYAAAAVTLDLACAAAITDGEISAHELLHLTRQINSWAHLSEAHRKRLKSHLRLGIDQPPTLAALKKKLGPLPEAAKRSIGRFLAHLAQADGQVTPHEVKFLERVYKTLGLDAQLLYSDLHAVPETGTQATPAPVGGATKGEPATGFTLDAARIAQLQKETEEVSALLASVFAEVPVSDEVLESATQDEPQQADTGLLGLSADLSTFLRRLISRHSWPREDLNDVAADMELMLDGTLEHINETMLDMFESTLTEGEDPIEINQELLEKIPA